MSAVFPFTPLPPSSLGDLYEPADPPQSKLEALAARAAGKMEWPPGKAGALAMFVCAQAPRPVREVGIVASLGWLAGVAGKAYVTPRPHSGLNIWAILVGRSAIGKEAMQHGVSKLTRDLRASGCAHADCFVCFDDFASGPALRKAIAARPSFVNVSSEFGHKIEAMAAKPTVVGPMQTLMRAMLDLYHKSGPGATAGGLAYSNAEDNVAQMESVNYSLIGETTPGKFRASLTSDMMENGFLSRFDVFEYDGDRPDANEAPLEHVPPETLEWASSLVAQAHSLISTGRTIKIEMYEAAASALAEFNAKCDAEIRRAGEDESRRQMWNRAHLKAVKIACLLAVADNHIVPRVTYGHAKWALSLVQANIALFARHLANGDVGNDDDAREKKLLKMCKEFLQNGAGAGYHIPDAMHQQGVIPRKFFQLRTSSLPLFQSVNGGAIRALDATLRSLCDSGYLLEVDKLKAADTFGFQGRCYRVVNLPGGRLW